MNLRVMFVVLALLLGGAVFVYFTYTKISPAETAESNVTASQLQSSTSGQQQAVAAGTESVVDAASEPEQVTVLSLLAIPSDFVQTKELYALLADADVPQLQQYIQQALSIERSSDRNAALAIILSRYADLDPEGAISQLYAQSGINRRTILRSLFSGWGRHDLQGAIRRLQLIRKGRDYEAAASGILSANSDQDIAALKSLAKSLGLENYSYVLGDRLAEQALADPQAAIRAILALEDSQSRGYVLGRAGEALGESDMLAALDFARNIPDQSERNQFIRSAIRAFASRDPEAALAMLPEMGSWELQYMLVSSVFPALAQMEPAYAMEVAAGLEKFSLRRAAMHATIRLWATRDHAAAMAAVERIESPGLQQQLMQHLITQMARTQPEESLALARKLGGIGGHLWSAVMSSIADSDPALALEIIQSMQPSSAQAGTLSMVFNQLIVSQPDLVIQYLDSLPAGQLSFDIASNILRSWGQYDAASAFAWLMTQPPVLQSNLIHILAYSMPLADIGLALELVQEIESSQTRNSWISSIVNQYARQDPFQAAAWLQQYADHPQYSHWMSAVVRNLASQDPPAALEMAAQISNPKYYWSTLAGIGNAWLRIDPESAANWAANLPWNEHRADLISSLASEWYGYDPAAAEAWIMGLNNLQERDAALFALISNQFIDQQAAEGLINRISAESMRIDALRTLIRQIARHDLDAARSLLNRSRLSEAQRQELAAIIAHFGQQG